jgi:2,3,4,5-tetrahydropyridine-2-carboxylate N-succinyltransferase/tetrahydrodipicolinate N-acetyltransferase
MDAQEIINYISNSEKKTPVKLYVNTTAPVAFGDAKVFGRDGSYIVFGDWAKIAPILKENAAKISDLEIENDRRNSGVPLLDLKGVNARIEPGALIREKVEIGDGAGDYDGRGDQHRLRHRPGHHDRHGRGAGRTGQRWAHTATSARARCWPAWWNPPSATPVIIEDNVLVGANAVVIEGVHVGKNAVVAAGAVVVEDVPENAVVAGCPAKVIKMKDAKTEGKTALVDALRKL